MRVSTIFVPGLVVLGLTGCSAVWLEQAGAAPEEPAVIVTEPCQLYSGSDLETIFGTQMSSGRNGISRIDDAGIDADSRHCRWNADALDASVQVAYPSDFDSGELACIAPGDQGATEVDLGSRAWWSELSVAGVTVGRLRVCSDGSLVDITIVRDSDAAPAGSDVGSDLRSQAELMGKVTLLRLGP